MADHDKPQGPVSIDSLAWSEWSRGVRFASRFRVLSDTRNGGRKIGIAYEELPPRQAIGSVSLSLAGRGAHRGA
jgi:hypothetical protein